jgi:hypothetical protein
MNDLYHVTSLIASQRVSLSVLRDSRTRRDDATEPVSEREKVGEHRRYRQSRESQYLYTFLVSQQPARRHLDITIATRYARLDNHHVA